MPRESKTARMNQTLNALTINRTVGLEIEGYMRDFPRGLTIRNAFIKYDGSLNNAGWHDHSRPYGVEIATDPLSRIAALDETFADIKSHRWTVGRGSAGLHIHVDTSDFTLRDKVKAAYFAKRVEDVMFLFVKNGRYRNEYCHLMSEGFIKIVEAIPLENTIWNVFRNFHSALLHYRMTEQISGRRDNNIHIDFGRYNWLNVFSTHYPTIEFRMFNAISNEIQGKQYAVLAHNFIETVKNCTVGQLQFIANTIDAEPDIKTKGELLLSSLQVPFELPIIGLKAVQAIESKQRFAASTLVLPQGWNRSIVV
jgi:hypothetical protein